MFFGLVADTLDASSSLEMFTDCAARSSTARLTTAFDVAMSSSVGRSTSAVAPDSNWASGSAEIGCRRTDVVALYEAGVMNENTTPTSTASPATAAISLRYSMRGLM